VTTGAEQHANQNPGAGTLEARRTGVHKTLIYNILLMDGQTLPYDDGFGGA
jgi:hypothetical protein